MAFSVTVIETNKTKKFDYNGSYVGDRVEVIAHVDLDGYTKATGHLLDADAFGLEVLNALYIQSTTVSVTHPVTFDWNPSTGYLKAYDVADGGEVETNEIDGAEIRVIAIGS